MMRILVTGAAGFVGSHLADTLVKAGHEVSCLLRPGSAPRWLSGADVRIVDCGMDSAGAMSEAVAGVEVIYHMAGVTKAFHAQGYVEGNVPIARNLVDAVTRYGDTVKAVVGVSSQAAAGPHPGPDGLTESDPPTPVSYYGMAKLRCEEILRELASDRGVAIIRPPMVYGPRDCAFLPLYSGVRLGVFPAPGSPDIHMSIVHVDDLVRGIILAGGRAAAGTIEPGSTYYISGQTATWREIAGAIGTAMECRPRVFGVPSWLLGIVASVNQGAGRLGLPTNHLVLDKWREGKQLGWVCSHAKAARELGYEPRMGLEEGFRDTVAWCRERGWL